LPVDEINSQIAALYEPCCADHAHNLEGINLSDESDALNAMIEEIYRLQGTDGTINQAVTKIFADNLWAGVVKGFGDDLVSIDYDSPDHAMLLEIQKNVWQFSAAKNYQQLRELSDALLDENGNLRTFEQFKEFALKINAKYVKTWMRTEYNLAVTGAQAASMWLRFNENKSTLPLLMFDAVMDSQTTDLCRSLDGTIRPVDDAFWNVYMIPNHFGERSTIRQLSTGVVTPDHKLPTADIPDMFKTNLAKQGLIFPEKHAYFIGIPNDIINQYNGG
jgi:SPP1 gp7 family putative phage head morphogenesis protein